MVSNLRPEGPALAGIGPLASVIDQHVIDNSGRRRDYQTLRDELGDGIAQGGILEYELRRRLRAPRARGYPPRVFISYHRQTPDHINWCKRLARALEKAGYHVTLDELVLAEEVTTEDISVFIGLLALADVAILVLTDEYAPQPGDHQGLIGMRYWLYEEWSRISALRDWGLLEIVAVWRSGTFPGQQPSNREHIVQINNSLDVAIDATDSEQGLEDVLRFFGQYTGPRYDGRDLRTLANGAAAVVTASLEKQSRTASEQLHKIREFNDTEEYQLALAYWTASFHDKEDGARRAISILERNPGIPTCFLIAELLWIHDFDASALALFSRIADTPSLWRHKARFIMADILSRFGAFNSAVNNLNWTLQPDAHQLGGYWSQFSESTMANLAEQLARMQDAADEKLAATTITARIIFGISEKNPDEPWPTPSRECEFCAAKFPAEGYACIMCGGMQRFRFQQCPYCMQIDTCVQLSDIILCPICKLSRSDLGTMAVQFTNRRVGQEFSILNSDFETYTVIKSPLQSQSPVKNYPRA